MEVHFGISQTRDSGTNIGELDVVSDSTSISIERTDDENPPLLAVTIHVEGGAVTLTGDRDEMESLSEQLASAVADTAEDRGEEIKQMLREMDRHEASS